MSTATASLFFALLAVLCLFGTVLVVVLALARRARPGSSAARWFADLGAVALWLAWLVALVTTLGSLYFSEVAGFTPCKLCWYQRIAMYPLAVLLFVAALRKDRQVWVYVVPQAAIGAAIAAYHTQLQAFPEQSSSFCTLTAPCTERDVWELGFVSLPFMALTAFSFVIAMVLVARATGEAPADPQGDPPTAADRARPLAPPTQVGVS
jgi:disulfide bond formation protein DsbB